MIFLVEEKELVCSMHAYMKKKNARVPRDELRQCTLLCSQSAVSYTYMKCTLTENRWTLKYEDFMFGQGNQCECLLFGHVDKKFDINYLDAV